MHRPIFALALLSGCGTSATSPTTDRSGFVGIGQTATSGSFVFEVDAAFGLVTNSCTSSMHGSCTTTVCTANAADAGITRPPDAGMITITGARLPISLVPDPNTGSYAPAQGVVQLYAAGDALTVHATGGDVPAFDAVATAPAEIAITAPAITNPIAIAKATDLVFAWNGGSVGNVSVELAWNPTSDSSEAVLCAFPASAGTGTISSSLLPDAGTSGHIAVHPEVDVDTNAGSFAIHYSVGAGEIIGRFSAM